MLCEVRARERRAPREQDEAPADKPAPAAATPAQTKGAAKLGARTARAPVESGRSEEYYAIKTTIFNALIDTIDLGQLSRLDNDTAAEEIRDIVTEIISIKNVAMSIAEQEQLLQGQH